MIESNDYDKTIDSVSASVGPGCAMVILILSILVALCYITSRV
jgi:hypothetical protein